MPIFYKEVEQGSGEWEWLRATRPTASDIERIVTPSGKASTSALAYMNLKLAAWMLGKPIEANPYQSKWMEHGHENEDGACKAFEFQTGLETETMGFVTTDDGLVGCSPDRMVVSGGEYVSTLEVKSPAPHTQVGYLLANSSLEYLLETSLEKKVRAKKGDPVQSDEDILLEGLSRNLDLHNQETVDSDYGMQCQMQIWICEFDKAYVSAHNPLTPSIVTEIGRDDKRIGLIAAGVGRFNEIMLERREHMERKFGPFVRPAPLTTKPKEWGEKYHVSDEDIAIVREVMEEG